MINNKRPRLEPDGISTQSIEQSTCPKAHKGCLLLKHFPPTPDCAASRQVGETGALECSLVSSVCIDNSLHSGASALTVFPEATKIHVSRLLTRTSSFHGRFDLARVPIYLSYVLCCSVNVAAQSVMLSWSSTQTYILFLPFFLFPNLPHSQAMQSPLGTVNNRS